MDRIETLIQFLNRTPGDSFLQHALALEYIKESNDESARKLFEEILTRDPEYTGSYYHLAKLLERTGENLLAKSWYEKGLAACKQAGDQHAYNELFAAYEELLDS